MKIILRCDNPELLKSKKVVHIYLNNKCTVFYPTEEHCAKLSFELIGSVGNASDFGSD